MSITTDVQVIQDNEITQKPIDRTHPIQLAFDSVCALRELSTKLTSTNLT